MIFTTLIFALLTLLCYAYSLSLFSVVFGTITVLCVVALISRSRAS